MTTSSLLQGRVNRAPVALRGDRNQLRERTASALTRFHSAGADRRAEINEDDILCGAAHGSPIPAEAIDKEQHPVVRPEIPGMERNDFDLEAAGDVLGVYGEPERAVPLPVPVRESRAGADHDRGILRIVLPRASIGGIRAIPVRSE